ncbi:hypothetical protein WDZ16_02710 [Pseudokineococcus marinus]
MSRATAATTCSCAEEYARRWPDVHPGALAGVHDPLCRVRLAHLEDQRRQNGGVPPRRRSGTRGPDAAG